MSVSKIQKPFTIRTYTTTATTTSDGITGIGMENTAIVLCVIADGYICIPYKNENGAWRAKVLNFWTMAKVQDASIPITVKYYI